MPRPAVCDEPVPSPQIAAYNSGYAPLRGPKTYGLGHWAVVREAQRKVPNAMKIFYRSSTHVMVLLSFPAYIIEGTKLRLPAHSMLRSPLPCSCGAHRSR